MSNPTATFLNVLVKRLQGKEDDIADDIENLSLNIVIVAASKTPYFQELYDANQHRDVIVIIPAGTKKLEKFAFMGCTRIKRVFIPSSVVEIEPAAFVNCSELTELMFETDCSLTIIGSKAFLGCTSLTSISNDRKLVHTYRYTKKMVPKECVLPQSLSIIGAEAFVDCCFNKIIFPESLTEIRNGAFSNCAALETLDIPNINIIGDHAFMYCSALVKVRFPNGGTYIPRGMFAACIKLSDIIFPDTLTRIEVGAFSTCTALKEVIFTQNSNLVAIQDNGFIECTALTTVVLPRTLERLGLNAFYKCDSLSEFYCSINTFNDYLFIINQNSSSERSIQTHYHIHEVSRLGMTHNKIKKLERLSMRVKYQGYNDFDEKLMEPRSETANSIEIHRNMDGYSTERLLGKAEEEIQVMRRSDRDRILELLYTHFEGGLR